MINNSIYIYSIFISLVLIIINILLVLVLIYRGQQNKRETIKKNKFKNLLELSIFSEKHIDFHKNLNNKDIVLLESVLFEYISPLKNSIERDNLVKIAYESGMVEYYNKLLTKGSQIEKNIALIKLGTLRTAEAIPKILELLNSDTINMFLNSAYALIKIEGPKYLPDIITKLSHFKSFEGYSLIEKRIMNIIADMTDDIFDTLEELFNSNDSKLIIFSIKILSYRKDSRLDNYIIKFLEHEDICVKNAVKEAAIYNDINNNKKTDVLLR